MVANPFPVYLILYKLLQIKQKKANQTTTTCVNNFGNQWKITTVKITTNVLKRVFCLDQRWRNWIVINGVEKGRKKLMKTTSMNKWSCYYKLVNAPFSFTNWESRYSIYSVRRSYSPYCG